MAGLVGKTSQYWSTFDPRSIGGCTLWLNETSVVQSGANVTDWLDKSGKGNNLTTDISFGYPSVSSNYFNNLNMVRFNSNYMFSPFASNITPFTGFVVTAIDTSGAINNVISIAATDTSNCIGLTISNGKWFMDSSSGAFPNTTFANNDTTCNAPLILEYTLNSNLSFIRRCGRQLITTTTNTWPNNSNTTSFQVGSKQRREQGQVQSNCLKGHIGEVIFYNTQLSLLDRQAVEGYLAWKWNANSQSSTLNNFSPLSISNCRLWFDGRDICGNGLMPNTTAIFGLTLWKDKSGNNYDATQTGSGNPIFILNGGTRYQNSTRFFNLPNGALPSGNTSYSYFVVVANTNATGEAVWLSGGNFAFGQYNAVENTALVSWPGGAGLLALPTNTYARGAIIIAETHYNSSLGARIVGADEVRVSAIPSAVRTQGTTSNAIGRNLFSGGTFAGNIYEIVVYDRQVTLPERRQIINYLSYKWNTSNINIHSLLPTHSYIESNVLSRLFTPLDISTSTVFWLDASQRNKVELNSASRVSNWIDKSQLGFNFTNGLTTGNYGPGRSNALNGMDMISFNGVSGSSGNTLSNVLATLTQSNHCLVAMTKPTVTNSNAWGNTSLFRNQPSGGYVIFPYMQGLTPRGYTTSSGGGAGISAANSLLVTNSIAGSNEIIVANIGRTSQQVFRNGTLQSSSNLSLTSGTQAVGNFHIGSSNGTSEFYAGDVGELLAFSNSLGSNEREKIEGYLAWKWGRQSELPSFHPFSKIKPLASSFSPNSLVLNGLGPTLWFSTIDPISFSYINSNGSIGTWRTKMTSTRIATFVTTTGTLRLQNLGPLSQPVLPIDISTDTIRTSETFALGGGISIFAVIKTPPYTPDTYWFSIANQDGNNDHFRFAPQTTNGNILSMRGGIGTVTRVATDICTNFMIPDTWYVTSLINSNASTAVSNDVYWAINGQQRTLTDVSNATVGSITSTIGLNDQAFIGGATLSTPMYAEILTFSRVLPRYQAKQIEGYLAWKWGLQSNLPFDHPFRGAIP